MWDRFSPAEMERRERLARGHENAAIGLNANRDETPGRKDADRNYRRDEHQRREQAVFSKCAG